MHQFRRELVLLGAGAIYIAACAVGQHLTSDGATIRLLDNSRWTLDCLVGLLLTYWGLRDASEPDRPARWWFLVGWLCYTIGQIAWDIQVAVGWNPFPGPSDPFFIGLPLFISVGFLDVLFRGLSGGERRAVVLDLTSIIVMSLTLTLALYLPLWHSSSAIVNVTAVLYPVLYLAALGTSVLTVLTRKIKLEFGSVLAVLSLAGWSYCWLEWNLRTLRGENLDAILVGYGFSVFMLLAAAALGKWRGEPSSDPTYVRWTYHVQRLFPLVLVLTACLALVFGHRHFTSTILLVIDMGAVAMIVLAAARQSLVLYEQDQILVAERKLRESEQRAAEARLQVDRIKHDLSIARSIQQGLLPREHPNIQNYDIAGWNQPADETGGDYYDWQDLERDRIVISLADATGHGIGPALVTSVCRAYARACMDGAREELHDVLRRVNRLLSGDVPSGRFVTFFTAVLDASKHRLNVLSAGHGPIFYYCAAEKSLRNFDSHGLPLAVDSNAEFGPADSFDLAPGDFLAVFTDGFFEWESPSGESFGTARLADSLIHHAARPAAQMITGVRDDLSDFVGDSPQGDDLTAVIVRRSPESG